MNILHYFLKPKKANKSVFIVEDNPIYARSLEQFIRRSFPEIEEISIFPVSESAILELKKNPGLIIMDHYLNSRYHDAVTGLDAIREIKSRKPGIPIMLLSAQDDISIAVEATQKYDCHYIRKNDDAFNRVQEYLHEVFK